MTPTRILVVLLTCTVGAVALRAEEKDKPDAAKVLSLIDAALFFPDSQTDLKGYTCRASVTTSSKSDANGVMVPDASDAEFLANISVDAVKGTRTWKDKNGKTIPAGAWSPSCGPWTLTNVMQVETELFLSALSPRFPETAWKREISDTTAGWRLVLTPKSSSVNAVEGDSLTPSVAHLELLVGRTGIPTRGTLGLELDTTKEDGEMVFEFVDVLGKKRIEKIRSTLKNANLIIHPELRFHFEKQKGFPLPARVVFEVPAGDLSPTMGRMMGGTRIQSALLFTDYEVKGKKKRGKNKR